MKIDSNSVFKNLIIHTNKNIHPIDKNRSVSDRKYNPQCWKNTHIFHEEKYEIPEVFREITSDYALQVYLLQKEWILWPNMNFMDDEK